jgi:hypothetical protein
MEKSDRHLLFSYDTPENFRDGDENESRENKVETQEGEREGNPNTQTEMTLKKISDGASEPRNEEMFSERFKKCFFGENPTNYVNTASQFKA